jgi:hypothetical protein
MVVGVWFKRFVIRVRHRRRPRLGAGDPRARPNERQACDAVAILAVIDAANRFHIGY